MMRMTVSDDNNKQTLTHGQIVQIYHVESKNYLYSENIPVKAEFSFFKKKTLQLDKFIVGSQPLEDVNNLWQVLRVANQSQHQPNSPHDQTTIFYDDSILLCHFITRRYLTSTSEEDFSQTIKEEVCCTDESLPGAHQIFMFQKIDDPYIRVTEEGYVLDNKVYGDAKLRIININDNRVLHSHPSLYTQKDANHLKEVTLTCTRSKGDFWQLQIADQKLLNKYRIQQPNYEFSNNRLDATINHRDKVIIKNCLVGSSLHSHTRKYLKGSKEQEVTCRYNQPRDDNDWWRIISPSDEHEGDVDVYGSKRFKQLRHLSKINLLHPCTNNYLRASSKYQNPSGKGIEVCCLKASTTDGEWEIIVVNSDLELGTLPIEHPFLIKHVPTKQYLGVFQNPSSPSDGQFEVGLLKDTSHATMWQVEAQQQQESI